jgi:uncharacterized membrane protein YkoI
MTTFARPVRLLQQGLLWACVLAAGAALASSDDDHEQARRAVVRGEVLPLKQVLQHLERQRPGGQVLEVELEKEEGLWVYEIKQLETGGLIVKIKLDAKTGVLLQAKPRSKS